MTSRQAKNRNGALALCRLLLGAVLLWPINGWADDVPISDTAKRQFEVGVAFLDDPEGARYEDAYRAFKAAHADSPSPKILGNVGLCAMKLERDAEAIDAYGRYLKEVQDIDFIKLLDFGVSKFRTIDPNSMEMTKSGVIMGTPDYMSPEQVESTKYVDHRADIYAVGVLLYEALSGRVPYAAKSLHDLLMQILNHKVKPLDAVAPNVDSELTARATDDATHSEPPPRSDAQRPRAKTRVKQPPPPEDTDPYPPKPTPEATATTAAAPPPPPPESSGRKFRRTL